jgi:hypothetical protein
MVFVRDNEAGPEYYSEDGPYRVFVAVDANVPFVTGVFNPEEAAKPLSSLEPNELFNLEYWTQFYIDEERYPFIGLLEGDLYDKHGNPTEEMNHVKDKIESVKVRVAEREKKTAEIIARRKIEDEERKRLEEQFSKTKENKIKSKGFFDSLFKYFRGNQKTEL